MVVPFDSVDWVLGVVGGWSMVGDLLGSSDAQCAGATEELFDDSAAGWFDRHGRLFVGPLIDSAITLVDSTRS